MENNNKKGFTIVELVIVIAVIAILAAVMIPTFAGVISKAKESAALQAAQNRYKELYAEDLADGQVDGSGITTSGSEDYSVGTDASENPIVKFTYNTNGYTVTYEGETWKAEKTTDAPAKGDEEG